MTGHRGRGLRHAGGTSITICCGREAIMPASPDDQYSLESDQGTRIDTDNFPDADLVCPGCERTWPDDGDCGHESFTVKSLLGDEPKQRVHAICNDCGDRLYLYVDIEDVRRVADVVESEVGE